MRFLCLLWLTLLSFSFSCIKREEVNRRTQSPSAAPPQGITAPLPPVKSARQFGILDPNYDYNPADPVTAAELARRFPVFKDGKSEVAFLQSGPEFYAARMHLLNQATTSVRIQSLIFKGDESGFELMQKLIELQKKGVKVRIVIDPITNYNPDDQKVFYYLQRHGITVEGYELLYLNLAEFASSRSSDEFGLAVMQANMRYHEKLFIIDAEIPEKAMAIAGGANIANEYFRVNADEPKMMWTDRDLLVRGPIVLHMAKTFDETEREFRTERINLGSLDLVWAIINATFGKPKELELNLRPERQLKLREFAALRFAPEWQSLDIRFIQSRPRFEEDLIFPAYLDMIDSAKSEILVCNAYFIAEDSLIAAFGRAMSRGVNVRLITNHVLSQDLPQLQKISRTKYKKLLALNDLPASKGKLSINEWAGDAVLKNGEGQNHGKYMVVDRLAVLVGSYNLDPRSRYLNSESVLVFENASEAAKYAGEFDRGLTPQMSLTVTAAEAETYHDPEHLEDQFELELLKLINPLL